MSSIPPPPPAGPPGSPPSAGMPPLGMAPTAPPPLRSTPIPDAPLETGPLKPGKIWVVLGSLLMVAGAATAIAIAAVGFVDALKKVTGCDECSIDRADTYQLDPSDSGVFFLYMEGYDDAAEAKADFRNLEVELVDASGDRVDLNLLGSDFTLSFDGVDLVAVAEFDVPDTGPFTLTVADPAGQGVSLRFGSISVEDIAKPVLLGAAIGGGLFLVGLVMLIVTLVKRSKARKRRRIAQGPPPGMSPWVGAPVQTLPSSPPMPWGTPPPPPSGQWNPPQ